jgi:hypothetical protein
MRHFKTLGRAPAQVQSKLFIVTIQFSGEDVPLRRGRCLAEIDLMNKRPRPAAGNGVFACATAARMSSVTCGSDRWPRSLNG